MSSTLAGIRASASSKAASAASGSPEPANASSSAGVNSVSTSRARGLRTAARRPKCQPRTVSAAASGRSNPSARKVASVSGSSATPVKTRLPEAALSAGASSNSRA